MAYMCIIKGHKVHTTCTWRYVGLTIANKCVYNICTICSYFSLMRINWTHFLYPRIHVVYKGVYRNQRVVGRSVANPVGRSVANPVGRSVANLASRTTSSVCDQFSWNLAEMFALECRCARHIFRQWQKECCHGNGILWQKWGKNLASRTTSSVCDQFSWNLAQMFALGCRCARHIFWQW